MNRICDDCCVKESFEVKIHKTAKYSENGTVTLCHKCYDRRRLKKYHILNKESINKRSREHYSKNRKSVRAVQRKYESIKYKTDPIYRMTHNYRKRTAFFLHNKNKSYSTFELLGCDSKQLRDHIQSKFTGGMTLDNYGKWHLDHIRPCASFDLTDPEQQKECFHYTNLQPMWASENISKGAWYKGVNYNSRHKSEPML